MEQWKPIERTNGKIEVSSLGRIRSTLRGSERLLKTQRDKKGYFRVTVTIEKEKMHFKVHREVAKAFIPNQRNLPQINHLDGDKSNNAVENLEWISNRDNAVHARVTGLWDSVMQGAARVNELKKKPVIAICGDDYIEFESVSEAERHFNSRHISDVLKGKREHVHGWSFRYKGGDAI